MMIDKTFHDVFKADVLFVPTPTPVYCRKCGTKLKIYYAEERLYVVKCGYCESVTLVKADNPTQAARYVGFYKEGHRKGIDDYNWENDFVNG